MARKKKPPAREPDALFEGVETDELGVPVDGAEISEEDLEHAPVDSKSARIATEYRKAVSRKAAGDTGVKFNTPDPYKYNGMAKVHPEAKVIILQVDPPDDKIPETTVSHLGDYGMMRAWVRDNFWDSSKTTKYSWAIHSGAYPYATGHLVFQAQPRQEDPMNRYGQQPPPGAPYGVQQPYPGMPPYPPPQQPYPGMPPYPPQQPYPYMQPQPMYVQQQPQPVMQQPQQPQQQPQQAAPPPPPPPAPMPQMPMPTGMDPVMASMFQMFMQQLTAAREENAQLRMYYQQQPVMQQAAQVAPLPPPPPKGPLEQLREMSEVVSSVSDLTNNMRRKFAPEDALEPPDPVPTLQSDEGFPLKVKDFGSVRAVATEDGKVSYPLWANVDKAGGLIDGFLERVEKMLDKVGAKRTESIREQVELMERAEGVANRTAAVRGHPQQPQQLPQQRPATPVNMSAVSMGAAPSARPPSPPQHPWDKFAQRTEVAVSPPAPQPVVVEMPSPPPPQEPAKEVQVVEMPAEVAD
jgi:hypothetical protein